MNEAGIHHAISMAGSEVSQEIRNLTEAIYNLSAEVARLNNPSGEIEIAAPFNDAQHEVVDFSLRIMETSDSHLRHIAFFKSRPREVVKAIEGLCIKHAQANGLTSFVADVIGGGKHRRYQVARVHMGWKVEPIDPDWKNQR